MDWSFLPSPGLTSAEPTQPADCLTAHRNDYGSQFPYGGTPSFILCEGLLSGCLITAFVLAPLLVLGSTDAIMCCFSVFHVVLESVRHGNGKRDEGETLCRNVKYSRSYFLPFVSMLCVQSIDCG